MPILVKDYDWSQTNSVINLVVPLKAINPNKVDVFCSSKYIKVSFPPYLVEVFPTRSINGSASKIRKENGLLSLTCEKVEPAVWDDLQDDTLLVDKSKLKEIREKALDEVSHHIDKREKAESEWRCNKGRELVKNQMALDQNFRDTIQFQKDVVRQEALTELEEVRVQRLKLEQQRKEADKVKQIILRKNEAMDKKKLYDIQDAKKDVADMFSDNSVRASGKIKVNFTPRAFPTPSRESQHSAEQEWLKKQQEARQICVDDDADLKPEEKDPVYMRDKGVKFMQEGNFQSAIAAFSHGIRMNAKFAGLYSNRAACHLKLGNLIKSVEDSSKAIELLNPPVVSNLESRFKAHVRRGTAFAHLHMYVEGLQDFAAALKLKDDPKLEADAQKLRQLVQKSEDSPEEGDDHS